MLAQKTLKHQRVKHYGYEFRYDNNNVDKDNPLPGGLPEICEEVLERCLEKGYVNIKPDQLTVNQYEPGQGIPPHVDTHSPFEDTIISLSLGAKTVMDFKHPDGRSVAVMLPRRSLLVMTGESRYLWTHGITPRKFDVVPASEADEPGTERRLAAINELVRLLRPGGRALIYVWAMEQEYKKQKSKYLKKNKAKPGEAISDTLQQEFSSNRTESSTVSSYEAADFKKSPSVAQNQCELRVHMNRTSFHSQDLLVPWHLKGSVEKNKSAEEALRESADHSKAAESAPVFHRFYHVFCEGELENLCRKIENVTIYRNYYDQGNWCVIIEKSIVKNSDANAGKAKEEYEKAERRKELKRARGEDTWMLPDVDLRLKELEEAKEEYEKAERRKELKRARGEDTWMLPDVHLRLKEIEEEQSGTGKKKKKKEKKSKKTKKEKKKKDKKERKAKGDDSDDNSARKMRFPTTNCIPGVEIKKCSENVNAGVCPTTVSLIPHNAY
ncbi:UNVERIFIED_CONTAM: hypothetical protein FKN15_008913 [Acipenser sinensis]